MSRILIISLSDLSRDPRVDRQIDFLRPAHEIVAAGLGPPAHADVEFVDLRTSHRPKVKEGLRQARSLVGIVSHRYEDVYWRHPVNRLALARLSDYDADLVIANDLSVLPLACRLAGSAPVIFDAHELATEEQAHLTWWRMTIAPYADALLRTYLPQTAAMMTVSQGIAERYAARYHVQPVVVTNAPPATQLEPTAVHAPIRLVHHGVALPERGLELMIEAVAASDRFTLDLMLVRMSDRYYTRLRRFASARPRVRLIEPVQQREIIQACNDYDIGVYVLPPLSANQTLALPNKLFEFIQARLAVVIGPSPEMARVVRAYDCGVVAEDFTAESLTSVLNALTPERIETYKQNSDSAAGELSAERNREIVLGLVDRALVG